MFKITIIGTGNISYHLEKAFAQTHRVIETTVVSGRGNALSELLNENAIKNESGDGGDIINVYIITVSDDAIKAVSQHFKGSGNLVIHTSGSVPMEALPEGIKRGVLYPLQTFSRDRVVDLRTVPICIEAERKEDLNMLRQLAGSVSDAVYEINSEQRKALHLAAVFVNNFTNHLYEIGAEICAENKVPFELLKPLIKETALKIETLSPFAAQTGPARRNDMKTIQGHLDQLTSDSFKEIYNLLTQSIKTTYGEKL